MECIVGRTQPASIGLEINLTLQSTATFNRIVLVTGPVSRDLLAKDEDGPGLLGYNDGKIRCTSLVSNSTIDIMSSHICDEY
jgi:hypothetical protein